jgi:hypothetical protein
MGLRGVTWKNVGWAFVLATVAALFNPFVIVRTTRQTWEFVDVTGAFLLWRAFSGFALRDDSTKKYVER